MDIDGVLASENFLASPTRNGFIEPAKVELLNQLEGAEIVITSSWGYDNGETEKTLRKNSLKLPIIGYTNRSISRKNDWACRGNEIEDWIIKYIDNMGTKFGDSKNRLFEYVIIDDDRDFLLGQQNHFICTRGKDALTQEHIDKAKVILAYNLQD